MRAVRFALLRRSAKAEKLGQSATATVPPVSRSMARAVSSERPFDPLHSFDSAPWVIPTRSAKEA
jgi:hypothetical protein